MHSLRHRSSSLKHVPTAKAKIIYLINDSISLCALIFVVGSCQVKKTSEIVMKNLFFKTFYCGDQMLHSIVRIINR